MMRDDPPVCLLQKTPKPVPSVLILSHHPFEEWFRIRNGKGELCHQYGVCRLTQAVQIVYMLYSGSQGTINFC